MTARPLRGDRCGTTVTEFALITPVMALLLMGGFDMAHTLYTKAVLQGVVQKAARDAALEARDAAGAQAAIDAAITAQVRALHAGADVQVTRRFYRSYAEAAVRRAEEYTDTNGNHTCDAGEPYIDANNNHSWDRDGGDAGQGSAKDATIFTVRVDYPRITPVHRLMGGSDRTVLTARTVLRNQPYGDQQQYAAATPRTCT